MINDYNNEEEEVIEEEVDIEEVETTEDDIEEEETVESLKKKLATTTAQKEHFRQKAQSRPETTEAKSNYSLKDLNALQHAGIVEETDLDEVESYASWKKVSIAEALKSPALKATLAQNAEMRGTANATNTTNSRRGSTKLSGEALISNAQRGKLPEDDDGINALIAAKRKSN